MLTFLTNVSIGANSLDTNQTAPTLFVQNASETIQQMTKQTTLRVGLYVCEDGKACVFDLKLYTPVNNFSVMSRHFPGLNQYYSNEDKDRVMLKDF